MVSNFLVLAVDGMVMDARKIISFSFHDEAGVKSDHLEVELTPDMPRPRTNGIVTAVLFNSRGGVMPCGIFYVESVTRTNNKAIRFTANGVEFNEKQLKKHSKHYEKTKLSSIVKMAAGRMGHGVKFCAPDPKIESLNQNNESDLHFLDRLAKKYDCLFSIKNNVAYFVNKSYGCMPVWPLFVPFAKESSITRRKVKYHSCEATYYDQKKAKEKKVKVGGKKPLLKIRSKGKTRELAKIDAKAALSKATRYSTHGHIHTMGQTIYASTKVFIIGTHDFEDDGIYWIHSCTHHFNRHTGWTVDVEFENLKPR